MTIGALPLGDQELDLWVAQATDGMITELPEVASDDTLMLLATALAMDVAWEHPFTPGMLRWKDEARVSGLYRSEPISDAAAIAHGECSISRYVCASTSSIDVHLVAGSPGDDPGAVLRTGLACLDGSADVRPGSSLRRGDTAGCLSVEKIRGDRDEIRIAVPRFSLRDEDGLTERPELFGLSTASDSSSGHFDLIAREPLAVERAMQAAVADFSESGFRAAASTFAAMMAGAGIPEETCHVISLKHDRPFGFLAVHRPTKLVLFVGWVETVDACEPWGSDFDPLMIIGC